MKYIALALVNIGICGVVAFCVCWTNNPWCLLGLAALFNVIRGGWQMEELKVEHEKH